MPFSSFGLHADLLLGVKELGFKRPTPIQMDAIPPAVAGKDVLACAMTGSGKSAAFLLPILNRLIGKKRGTTRRLRCTARERSAPWPALFSWPGASAERERSAPWPA